MRWSFWRRNASRVALEERTPDLPLMPRSPSRAQCCATRRTTDSERWMLRLSQTISHRVLGAALLSKLSRKRAKSCSVRVLPTTPPTLPEVTSKAAIRACVPWRRYSNSHRSTLPGFLGTGCGLVNLADVSALGVKGRIGFRRQPITKAMRFEVGLFFKNRPTERCEMLGTRPRRIASPAISRWLQWLIGRSLSDGLSQVIAITAQICSGVYVAGAPERGASQSRSGTDCPSGASRQRLRQYRTVFGHTSSSRALSRTPMLSA